MYYDKRIRYMDYLENGEKQRNCGYVKITVTGGRLLLEMQIKGLYATDDVASEVMLEGAGIENRIGTVIIHQGSGGFRWETQDPVHQGEEILLYDGMNYGRLERIKVHLSSRRSLYCVWRELAATEPAVTERAMEYAAWTQRPEEVALLGEKRTPETLLGTPDEQRVGETYQEETAGRENITRQREGARQEETVRQEEAARQEEAVRRENPARQEEAVRQEETARQDEAARQENIARQREEARQEEAVRQEETARQKETTIQQEALRQGKSLVQEETARREEVSIQKDIVSQERGSTQERAARMERQAAREALESSNWQSEPEESSKIQRSAGVEAQSGQDEPTRQTEQTGKEELHTAESQRRVSQEPPSMPMSEDKWQQLQRIYPHIRPFQDEREYLSLRPEDFVILRSNAYRLVQNSFLLHGYYNYKHLILTHVSQRNAVQYYIGVPGNFYEKEKQVAIMYGFDSFECKRDPAEDGDFGYYMIKVEL